MSDPEQPDAATQLIDALLADGEPIDVGGFTLDAAAAAAKLDAFQYADRRAYLVPIAEAAVGLEASEVRITRSRGDLLVSIAGVDLPDPLATLSDPWAHVQGRAQDRHSRALGRLGVGLHMVLGLEGVARVVVRYATDVEQWSAEYRPGQPASVHGFPRGGIRGPLPRALLILVDRSWLGTLRRLVVGHRAELAYLREAVRNHSTKFFIGNKRISGEWRRWIVVSAVHGEGPGYRWSVARVDDDRAAKIELRVLGVLIETRPGRGRGSRGYIEFEAPTRDLSQLRIVQDELVERALAEIEAAQHELTSRVFEPQPLAIKIRHPVTRSQFANGSAMLGAATLAGALGFGMLFHGEVTAKVLGLSVLMLMVAIAVPGANILAHVLVDHGYQRKRVAIGLIGVAGVLALVIAWGVGSLVADEEPGRFGGQGEPPGALDPRSL